LFFFYRIRPMSLAALRCSISATISPSGTWMKHTGP
jgi:hypothetical protein